MNRYDRQEALFGPAGQNRLRRLTVAIVGLGGLGSHVLQQLAHLGVGKVSLVDPDRLDLTNMNRLIGARHGDPYTDANGTEGLLKVDIGRRMVHEIDPSIEIDVFPDDFRTPAPIRAIESADWVFGCLDDDGSRLLLLEVCSRSKTPLIDTASDVVLAPNSTSYGGRVCVVMGCGCLHCRGLLSQEAIHASLGNAMEAKDHEDIYGIGRDSLGGTGPAVVYINGVIASLAVAEFAAAVTQLRRPCGHQEYRGNMGVVLKFADPSETGCYYCARYGWAARQ